MHWARLQLDVDCSLRRGAWYRVTRIGTLESVVDVNRKPHAVPSYVLQVVGRPPRHWTVVRGPAGAVGVRSHAGSRYVVCPSCRERAPLTGRDRPRTLDCQRCHGTFEVAWSEKYLEP
jgi:hypothetical protein